MHPGFSLIGARTDLGLSIRWRFSFLEAGRSVTRSGDVVHLDSGGRLEAGIVDHHQGEPGATSAARLVFEHPGLVHEHLVGPWIETARAHEIRGRTWTPTIALHADPDFDAIVSTVLAMELVETGRFPIEARRLVEYADRVDQGVERPPLPERRFELYPLILMLQHLPRSDAHRTALGLPESLPTRSELASIAGRDAMGDIADANSDELTLRLGMRLVRMWASAASAADAEISKRLEDDPVAAALASALEHDATRFQRACDRLQTTTLRLPCVTPDSAPIELPAAILPLPEPVPAGSSRDADRSVGEGTTAAAIACDKIYLRTGGGGLGRPYPVTVVEKARRPSHDGIARSRWIVAVDEASRSIDPAARADLRGLAASLEWAEQRRRRELGIRDSRRGATRFPEFPGIADPWYDGRGHQWTIVDSPRDGTVLDRGELEAILHSPFWEPEIEEAELWWWVSTPTPYGLGIAKHHQAFRGALLETMRDSSDDLASGTGPRARHAGDVRRRLDHIARDGGASPEYAVAAWRLRRGWSDEAVRASIRAIVGETMTELSLEAGRAFVGADATVVVLDHADIRFEPDASIDAVLDTSRMLRSLAGRAATLDIDAGGGDAIGLSRELRLEFVKRVSDCRGLEGLRNSDVSAVRRALEYALRLDDRIDATAQLLELLDDDAQRTFDGRLNRLVFVLALFGILEALIAGLVAFENGWIESIPTRQDVHRIWSLAVLGVTALLVIVLFTLPIGRFARFYASLPAVGPLLFPDRRRVRSRRGP
jgi:hypothetical protein